MDDLVRWLGEQFDEDERVAREACKYASPAWHLDEEFGETVLWWPPEFHTRYEEDKHWRGLAIDQDIAPHIAEWDPARVLREIDAKRRLVDDFTSERHHVNDGDCWYTCPAATEARDGGETCDDSRRGGACDCGRDARVERRLRLLAFPYEARPGYRAEWRP